MAQTYPIATPGISAGNVPLQAGLAALARVAADECGQDLLEYALIASFMGLASVAGVNGLASKIANDLNIVLNGFNGALAGHA